MIKVLIFARPSVIYTETDIEARLWETRQALRGRAKSDRSPTQPNYTVYTNTKFSCMLVNIYQILLKI